MTWLAAASLLLSGYLMFRSALRLRAEEACLAAAILAWAEALTLMQPLGWLDAMRPGPVRAATLAMFVCHLIIALALQSKEPPRPQAKRLLAMLPPPLWPAALILLGGLGLRIAFAWLSPPDSWDALSYHLPIVQRWIFQGGSGLEGWSDHQRYAGMGGEHLAAWLCLLGDGSLDPAKLVQCLALPLLAASGAVLGRRLAGPAWAGACALASCCAPIVLLHTSVAYVDLLYAGFCMAAAAAGVCFDRSGRIGWLWLFSAAFGSALAVKSTIYIQAPLLLLPAWTFAARPAMRRRLLLWALPLASLALIVGGTSYLRNWTLLGNPVFPFTFKMAGRVVFQGIMEPTDLYVAIERWFVASTPGWLLYPFNETLRGELLYSTENGFGPLFAAGWALFPLALWRAWRLRNSAAMAFLAILPCMAAMFIALQPTRMPRFLIALCCMMPVGAAFLLRTARGSLKTAALSAWSLTVAWTILAALGSLGREKSFAQAWSIFRREGRIPASEYYIVRFGALGQAWAALDARLTPGDVVVVNCAELILPWAGSPPRAVMRHVSHRPNDIPDSLWADDPLDWVALLESIDTRYLALWHPSWYPDVGVREAETVAQFPERFRKLGEWKDTDFGEIALYEFDSAQPQPDVGPPAEGLF